MIRGFFSPNRLFFVLITFLSSLAILILGGCKSKSYHYDEGMVWNTTYHITYNHDTSLTDSIFSVLNQVSSSLSFFDDNSILSRFNQSADSIKADTHLIKVYDTARRIYNISDGLYDPSVSLLIDAWGFGKGHSISPDTAKIDSLLQFVGMNLTERRGNYIIKKKPHLSFNFSSIAKGYGCDAIAEMFRRNGVSDYLIEIGGEIALSGKNSSGNKWTISIDRPLKSQNLQHESQEIIHLTNCGLATSGNYRNYHNVGKESIGHTISPKTGRPIKSDVISATVIAPTAMEADALATACMAAGKEGGIRICRNANADVMLILQDSTVYMSPGFSRLTDN